MSNNPDQTTREVLQGHIQDKPTGEQDKILEAFDRLDVRAQNASVGIMHLIRTGTFLGNNTDETD